MFIGLFYNSIEKEIFAEMALKEASRLNIMEAAKVEGNIQETNIDDQPSAIDAKNIKDKDKEYVSEPVEIQNPEIDYNRVVESEKAQESPTVDNQATNSKIHTFCCVNMNIYTCG